RRMRTHLSASTRHPSVIRVNRWTTGSPLRPGLHRLRRPGPHTASDYVEAFEARRALYDEYPRIASISLTTFATIVAAGSTAWTTAADSPAITAAMSYLRVARASI